MKVGFNSPRMNGLDGWPLPSPRRVSNVVLISDFHESIGPCFPIEIPVNDNFFKPRRCMNFVRSMEVEDPNLKCQSLFVRMHNRIARQLRRMNPRWNDESLFQETRTIVAAILQHITYNEWLPLVVGTEAARKYRSGRGLDLLVEGMLIDSSQDVDPKFGNGLKNRLFETLLAAGVDLPAINIQRGRDHGLAPYNEYRKFCGLRPIRFDGSTAQVRDLARTYGDPGDVDLYIGGMTERAVRDGVVGPTFACIIAHQFYNIKYGDRYWFENLQPPSYYNYHLSNPSALTKGTYTQSLIK
ncbi:myeloperoxidase-like [Patella vulgata]|uniref:myeloperoxidase-like n=1 Tax=Patella vulgata TaxID=6465 RepID=UPI00218006D8|nr:myeloperoxidase-like [Patella vulgata]